MTDTKTHRELMDLGYCVTGVRRRGEVICYARADADGPASGLSRPGYWRPAGCSADVWYRDDARVLSTLRSVVCAHNAADRHSLGGRR